MEFSPVVFQDKHYLIIFFIWKVYKSRNDSLGSLHIPPPLQYVAFCSTFEFLNKLVFIILGFLTDSMSKN